MKEHKQELLQNKIAERELSFYRLGLSIMEIMGAIDFERSIKFPFISQEEFAEKCGISLSTYKNYLNGMSDAITLKTYLLMIDELNLDFDEVI